MATALTLTRIGLTSQKISHQLNARGVDINTRKLIVASTTISNRTHGQTTQNHVSLAYT